MAAKKILMPVFFFITLFFTTWAGAANNTIYIKPFAILKGLPASDPIGSLFKDYLAEFIIEKGGYSIITDDEVKQVIQQEALKMTLDACYDDACIKKLMKSIRTDFVIYGTVSKIENQYYITSKVLDRTSGAIVLSRIKTVKFTKRQIIGITAKAVGEYLLTGDDDALKEIDDIDKSSYTAFGRKGTIVNKYPLIRLGAGRSVYYPDMNEYYYSDPLANIIDQFMIDIFLYRNRYKESSGFDIFARGFFKTLELNEGLSDEELAKSTGFNYTPENTASGWIDIWGADLGVRYITGAYFLGTHWQIYAMIGYQHIFTVSQETEATVNIPPDGPTDKYQSNEFNSIHGYIAGTGLEIAFWPYFGFFVELKYGYSPVEIGGKKRNIDGLNLLYGFTIRAGDML